MLFVLSLTSMLWYCFLLYDPLFFFFFFFFNDTATTEIYTLSLHDALPICSPSSTRCCTTIETMEAAGRRRRGVCARRRGTPRRDRKSTRLNSSHSQISYAVFCLKKKKKVTKKMSKNENDNKQCTHKDSSVH